MIVLHWLEIEEVESNYAAAILLVVPVIGTRHDLHSVVAVTLIPIKLILLNLLILLLIHIPVLIVILEGASLIQMPEILIQINDSG